MFSLVNGIYQAYFSTPQLNILVVGAQSVGKTTLMERIKVTEFSKSTTKQHARGVLDQYISPLSAADARTIFFADGTADEIRPDLLERDSHNNNGASRSSPLPHNDHQDSSSAQTTAVLLETPNTKRRLANMSTARQQRFRWICPAPKKYQQNDDESDSDSIVDHDEAVDGDNTRKEDPMQQSFPLLPLDPENQSTVLLPSPAPLQTPPLTSTKPSDAGPTTSSQSNGAADFDTSTSYFDTVEFSAEITLSNHGGRSEDGNLQNSSSSLHSHHRTPPQGQRPQIDPSQTDYDLKKNCKMLPLSKIRPTIGMNLGKIANICGAKCHVMDVGGRMQQLWERYYHDCDGVVFVWKIDAAAVSGDDEAAEEDAEQLHDGDDDSDDERPVITAKMQLQMLEQVRSSITEDVPFLILGQLTRPLPASSAETIHPDRQYSTSPLLPHYHNLYQALYFANAATGQGVRSALEWLIPLAKRQQSVRERSTTDGDKF
jgi:GTPase SAR1 family protein